MTPGADEADEVILASGVRYTPHARQELFHRAPQRWRWFCAGYGTGKTTALVIEAFLLAVCTHPGYQGVVAAPTYPLLYQSFVEKWIETIPKEWWTLTQDSKRGAAIVVHNGSKIWLRSSSVPASNEGINAAWLCYDEASREPSRDALNVLFSRVRQGYPGRQRSIIASGPPQTKSHWTAEVFGVGAGGGYDGDSFHWHNAQRCVVRARTRDNPNLPADYESDLRTRPGATLAWARQWLDAEFGAVEGQIYEAFSRDVHVVRAASLFGRKWKRSIVCVDWGYARPGVMLVLATDGMGDVYVTHEVVARGRLVEPKPTKGTWGETGVELVRLHKAPQFFCDPSSPANMEMLSRALSAGRVSAEVYASDNEVQDGISRVASLLEHATMRAQAPHVAAAKMPALYISDACQYTIGEMEGYVRKKGRDGEFTEQPVKANDHAMDALRYGVTELVK